MIIWYGVSSILLGVLLFFPVRTFILNLNVNRFQSKNNRKISSDELDKLKKKSTIIAVFIAVTFAFVYNKIIVIKFFGGTGN